MYCLLLGYVYRVYDIYTMWNNEYIIQLALPSSLLLSLLLLLHRRPYWWADSVAWDRDEVRYDCDRTPALAATGTWM